ncbi:hypothetical protein [Pseudomonas nitroreducens]|uniref:hypothetical protein n=1 Tax=Pseudomonas nitroreducens TaxID=46680 RepID=UPI00161B6FA8|nr:hypothetical protein [Pseudomonas nitritireducens]
MLSKHEVVSGVPGPYHHCRERMHRFLHESKGWDGYSANPACVPGAMKAVELLRVVYAAGIAQPSCVLGTGGEICLTWHTKKSLYVAVDCFPNRYSGMAIRDNEGSVSAAPLNMDTGPTEEVLALLREHFPADEPADQEFPPEQLTSDSLAEVLCDLAFWSPDAKAALEGFAVDNGRGYCASLETIRKAAWLINSTQHAGVYDPKLTLAIDGSISVEWNEDWYVAVDFNEGPTYMAYAAPADEKYHGLCTTSIKLTATYAPDKAPAIMPVLRRHCVEYLPS